ncbi:MAG: catalase, partial [Nitrosospira sp.]
MKTPGKTDNRSTVGGPAHQDGAPANDFTAKLAGAQELAAAMPYNTNKALEYGDVSGMPEKGQTVEPADPATTGSTLTEMNGSDKTGSGDPQPGFNAGNESLDRVRADSSGQVLTTNLGVPVGDNQNSLKAGYRGPALLEDFILREKITHFDHER